MISITAQNGSGLGKPQPVKEIQILVFNIMGVRFGADMEQIAEVIHSHAAGDEAETAIPFHEEFSFPGKQVVYESPRILRIKNGRGIVVDHLENILSLPVDQIRALPELLVRARKPDAIWGAGLVDDEVILLLDFFM